MIFASDLDRTLIYSEASRGTEVPQEEMVPVETNKGRYISFMSQTAIRLLTELSSKVLFVPVTTRTVEQYRRIFLFQETIIPRYAVTSNGGTILIDGEPDPVWREKIVKAAGTSASAKEAKALFDRTTSPDWALSERYSDDLFFSIEIDRAKVPGPEIEQLRMELLSVGWRLSLQGRKMYLVPERVSKGEALLYLKERLGLQKAVAAGDSLLDESLLSAADHAIAPCHGELFKHMPAHEHISYTTASGMSASEELLERTISFFDNGMNGKVQL